MLHELEIDEVLANSIAQAASAANDVKIDCREEKTDKPLTLTARQAKFLADVRVPIRVDIGTLNISADELIDLLPGNSFAFAFDPLAQVNLHVGGEKIGSARFIEQNAGLALEIISIGE